MDDLLHDLRRHRPRRLPGRHRLARAAVAVVLAERPVEGLAVLLARRAHRSGDPWSGDMAFPGGRQAPGDVDNLACALRETGEEIHLSLAREHCVGRLSDKLTRTHQRPLPMVVTPYVFRLPEQAPQPQTSSEIAETLWLPLAFLADPANRQRMRWKLGPLSLRMPCCDYRNRRIWGLTLMMLDELVRIRQQA